MATNKSPMANQLRTAESFDEAMRVLGQLKELVFDQLDEPLQCKQTFCCAKEEKADPNR